MSLRQVIRKEVKAVFDAMPNEQQLKKMHKEMEKMAGDFAEYRYGTSSRDPNFNVWAESHNAMMSLELALNDLSTSQHFNEQGKFANADKAMKDFEYNYKHGAEAYNKAKRLYRNANRK